jgi:transposase
MNRHELSDTQWAVIEQLLPQQKPGPGRRRADDRPTLKGILHVLKTGCAWEDMPRVYGAPTMAWRHLQTSSQDGTWERMWRALLSQLDVQGKLEWSRASLDGSFVPAKTGVVRSGKPKPARARR